MALEKINIGTIANDGTGDTLRAAGEKINSTIDALQFMTEAEFMELAALRREQNVASGVVGSIAFSDFFQPGLTANTLPTLACDFNVNGYATPIPAASWLFPEAPTASISTDGTAPSGLSQGDFVVYGNLIYCLIATSYTTGETLSSSSNFESRDEVARTDFAFTEVFFEKISLKDFVYPYGDIQYQGTIDTATGLTTINGSFSGYDTYSLYGEWQAADTVVGKGLVWSTMSDADKAKFASDPDNGVFLSEDGEPVQRRIRRRVVSGQSTSVSITDSYIYSQGGNATPTTNNFTDSSDVSALYESSDSYAVKCCAVPRLNQGAYHNVFNENGTRRFFQDYNDGGHAYFYSTGLDIKSTADCFVIGSNLPNLVPSITGAIGKTSGRPDRYYYDQINNIEDLRNSAREQDVQRTLVRETQNAIDGLIRGKEFEALMTSDGTIGGTTISLSDLKSNGTILRCALIGDPANYYRGSYDYLSSDGVQTVVAGETVVKIDTLNTGTGTVGNYYKANAASGALDLDDIDFTATANWTDLGADREDSWLTNSIPAEPSLSVLPDGVEDSFQVSHYIESSLLGLRSTDNGNTWSTFTPSASGNTITLTNEPSGNIVLYFYLSATDPTEDYQTVDDTLLDGQVVATDSSRLADYLSDKVWVGTSSDEECTVLKKVDGVWTHTASSLTEGVKISGKLVSLNNQIYLEVAGEEVDTTDDGAIDTESNRRLIKLPYFSREDA